VLGPSGPYKLSTLKQEEIDNLNRPITSNEIEAVIKNLPKNKSPGPDGFPGEFFQTFKDEIQAFHKIFQKQRKKKDIPTYFMRSA